MSKSIGARHRQGSLYYLDFIYVRYSVITIVLCHLFVSIFHLMTNYGMDGLVMCLIIILRVIQIGALGRLVLVLSHAKFCILAKFTDFPFPTSQSVSTSLFDLVISNIWGPASIPSCFGYLYI